MTSHLGRDSYVARSTSFIARARAPKVILLNYENILIFNFEHIAREFITSFWTETYNTKPMRTHNICNVLYNIMFDTKRIVLFVSNPFSRSEYRITGARSVSSLRHRIYLL